MFKLSNEMQGLFHKLIYFCCGFSTEGTNIDLPSNGRKEKNKIQQSANNSNLFLPEGHLMNVCRLFINYYFNK